MRCPAQISSVSAIDWRMLAQVGILYAEEESAYARVIAPRPTTQMETLEQEEVVIRWASISRF